MPNAGLQLSWCMYVSAICAVLYMYIVQSTVRLLHASTYASAPKFHFEQHWPFYSKHDCASGSC